MHEKQGDVYMNVDYNGTIIRHYPDGDISVECGFLIENVWIDYEQLKLIYELATKKRTILHADGV